MTITRENKKIEALDRMKALGLSKDTIRVFKNHDIVRVSEPNNIGMGVFGALYDLDDDEMKMVREVEGKWNVLVFHVVRSWTNFGQLDAMLIVSDYDDEWEMDRESTKEHYPMAYVVNRDYDWCSEFGSVYVVQAAGGLVRKF